jgi:hypothetical protein
MAPSESNERQDDDATAHVRSFLIDCLDNPGQGTERLPYLVSLLESDERPVRFTAAMTCCLIAIEGDDDDITEYLVRRMSDRLDAGEASLELTMALDYLSSLYADQVEQLLEEVGAENQNLPLPDVGNFTREYYYSRDYGREGVGRTRVAGTDDDDPRQTYADRQDEERDKREHEQDREQYVEDATESDGESEVDPEGGGPAWGAEFEDDPEAMLRRTTEVSTIAVKSRFDELHIRGDHRRSRYADTYEALVGSGGREEQAI